VIVPVVALILGAIVRHERPGSSALLGCAVILGAVATGLLGDLHARSRAR
jgi:drug/metabolite transporter (DMT)-like permease